MRRILRHSFILHSSLKSITLILVTINKKRKSTTDQSFALPLVSRVPKYPSVFIYKYIIMIRVNAILCKLNSIKLSDISLFKTFCDYSLTTGIKCPHCGNTSELKRHSAYERTLISISEGKRQEHTVSVTRVKCHCGKTSALIPDLLIPYGSYSIRFVLFVLWKYLTRIKTVEALCDEFHISKSTLYHWTHTFISQYNLWFGVMKEIDTLTYSSLQRFSSIASFPGLFFKRFHFSLFQNHQTTISGT